MNCRHTLNPGALSQLNDYNWAPQRLCLRAKRARHLIATLAVLASLPLLCMEGLPARAEIDARCRRSYAPST